jgi:hypothetical protein
VQSPWQNGTAERWVGSCRRELLDQVIALDERHLLRLIRDHVGYCHHDRIHDALKKDTPTEPQCSTDRQRPQESSRAPDWAVFIIDTTGVLRHSMRSYL